MLSDVFEVNNNLLLLLAFAYLVFFSRVSLLQVMSVLKSKQVGLYDYILQNS